MFQPLLERVPSFADFLDIVSDLAQEARLRAVCGSWNVSSTGQ